MEIITVDKDKKNILRKKTLDIREDELPLARKISSELHQALSPYFPAAGLAAPQIGIDKSLFIFSFDRDPKNLATVINPTFIPESSDKVEGWEGCLSVINTVWKIAKVPRYEKIRVSYLNLNGQKVDQVLEGFAAKAFQHEYDHLQGILNIDRKDAIVKSFETKEKLKQFMTDVKKVDSTRYKQPGKL